jgi:hypothetical protein
MYDINIYNKKEEEISELEGKISEKVSELKCGLGYKDEITPYSGFDLRNRLNTCFDVNNNYFRKKKLDAYDGELIAKVIDIFNESFPYLKSDFLQLRVNNSGLKTDRLIKYALIFKNNSDAMSFDRADTEFSEVIPKMYELFRTNEKLKNKYHLPSINFIKLYPEEEFESLMQIGGKTDKSFFVIHFELHDLYEAYLAALEKTQSQLEYIDDQISGLKKLKVEKEKELKDSRNIIKTF